jgi:ubiquinone/menaquinone biosynthesis C-methylase UbiE
MAARQNLEKAYRAVEGVITPGLKYSQFLYEDVLNSHVNGRVDWLDVGCGHQILPPWRGDEETRLVARCHKTIGIDADLESLKNHRSINTRVLGMISNLPFRDESFDLVTANMVVEHLDVPETQFREIARVLKPGGIFIFHTPNRKGYSTAIARMIPEGAKKKIIRLVQARKEEDVFKTFYRANSPEEIARVAETTGFKVNKLKMIVSSAQLAVFPPLVVFELMWIRLLMTSRFKSLRTNIIGILQKSANPSLGDGRNENETS